MVRSKGQSLPRWKCRRSHLRRKLLIQIGKEKEHRGRTWLCARMKKREVAAPSGKSVGKKKGKDRVKGLGSEIRHEKVIEP